MPKPMPSEGSEENPFTPITKKPSMAGTEETKQELPDASDDSDAFDPRVLDGTLEEDATYGDRTLPGGLKAPRATSLALRLAMRCAVDTEARRKATKSKLKSRVAELMREVTVLKFSAKRAAAAQGAGAANNSRTPGSKGNTALHVSRFFS